MASNIDIIEVGVNLDRCYGTRKVERDDGKFDLVVQFDAISIQTFHGNEAERFVELATKAKWKGWIHVPVNQHIPIPPPLPPIEETKEPETPQESQQIDRSKGFFTINPETQCGTCGKNKGTCGHDC